MIYLLSFYKYKYLSLTFFFLFDWWNQIVILYSCPVCILSIAYLKHTLTLSVPCIFCNMEVTLESWSNWDSDLFWLNYFTSSHQGKSTGCYTSCVSVCILSSLWDVCSHWWTLDRHTNPVGHLKMLIHKFCHIFCLLDRIPL